MDTETINVIKSLFEEYANKDSGTVMAAYLTVGRMLGVSILGAISQWIITKRIVSEEHKRMLAQVNSERFARQHASLGDFIYSLLFRTKRMLVKALT